MFPTTFPTQENILLSSDFRRTSSDFLGLLGIDVYLHLSLPPTTEDAAFRYIEFGGHCQILQSEGSSLRTFPMRGSTSCAVISAASYGRNRSTGGRSASVRSSHRP